MPKNYVPVKSKKECRACGSKSLALFFDLGNTVLANSFVYRENLGKPESAYPLRVFFCRNCSFVQLGEVVRPDILFRDYIYFSTGVITVPEHFRKYAEEITSNFITQKDDFVLEIGSNDGVLLGAVKDLGVRVLGIDPAVNIAKAANERGIPTIPEFFSAKLAMKVRKEHGPAKVMVGNNVVAHINDLHDLVRGVSLVLADDGVFIFEAPYLKDMFDNLTFDTIYHELLSYLSVRPLIPLFKKFGLQIFDVKTVPVQGNSLRVYVSKLGQRPVSESVAHFVREEEKFGLASLDNYLQLVVRIDDLKNRVVNLLRDLKGKGKRIAGYGAPAKGNTLLHYFGIGPEILEYATEELPSKIGLLTPGTHIPIIHVSESRKNPPDYYLMLAWNAHDAIIKNEREFLARGGKFIMPVKAGNIIDIS